MFRAGFRVSCNNFMQLDIYWQELSARLDSISAKKPFLSFGEIKMHSLLPK